MIIRQAKLGDAESLAQLAENTFRDTFTATNKQTDIDLYCQTSFSQQIQLRELQDPNYIFLLAELEDELIAFAQIRLHAPIDCIDARSPAELYRFYVLRQWHGQGLAHDMMSEVLATVSDFGSDVIWLGVWEQNPRAIAFYRKYNFKLVGEHIFQVGNDPQRDLVMALTIDGSSAP